MSVFKRLTGNNNWGNNLNPQYQAIRQKILNHPYGRLQSITEVAIAAELGIKIDVNQASVDDWLRLPGISIHQARSLVELIDMGVQILSLEDLAAALSIPIQRLKPLEPILAFNYYDTDSVANPIRFNPNTANLDELKQIPLLNSSLAEFIINNRQTQGNYRNLADLQRRLNLNSQIVSQLMHYLKF